MGNPILLLEDDESLIDGLRYSLKKNGFTLEVARTAAQAYLCLQNHSYDLLLLDITLPDGNGLDVCDWVRKRGNQAPIIFLTAMDEEVNIIQGLDHGGDDYITKPFKLGELCSRIRALLRRSGIQQFGEVQRLSSGPVSVDLIASRAFLRERPLELTGAEYRLLCLFLKNAGNIIPRNTILGCINTGQCVPSVPVFGSSI